MPQAARSRRVDQCCYVEDRRRCRRSATGNPPLCAPHRIAVADEVRRELEGNPAGAGISELFERIVSGKRVNRRVVEDAIGDAMKWFSEYEAQRRSEAAHPGGESEPSQRRHAPPRWWDPLVNVRQRAKQPPPRDPRVAELAQRRARARAVLGMDARAQPTVVELNDLRRKLARQHHPDRGGSVSKMQEINDAIDTLVVEVEERAAGVVS